MIASNDELPFMYKLQIKAMANGFCMVRYKGHLQLEVVEPEELLLYIRNHSKEEMVTELEKIIEKINKYKDFKAELFTKDLPITQTDD